LWGGFSSRSGLSDRFFSLSRFFERLGARQFRPAYCKAEFITPIPKPRKQKGKAQQSFALDTGTGLSTAQQQYEQTANVINELRTQVDRWRGLPDPAHWQVTPETERLLKHWRTHPFSNIRPIFCRIEAVEIAIWLTDSNI
jgi:type III restriction enzyme